MVCPEKRQAHERCDFPSRLARPDCHRRSREYADERDCHARRDRRTRRRQPATHHSRRLERPSELGMRTLRSLVSVLSVVSVLLFVFSVLNLWLSFPPAAKDSHHRGHKGHREKQNREIREHPHRTPTTCHPLPATSPIAFPPLGASREPGFAPLASLAKTAALFLRFENHGRHGTWIANLIEGDEREKSRGRVFPFSPTVVFRENFDAHFHRSMKGTIHLRLEHDEFA